MKRSKAVTGAILILLLVAIVITFLLNITLGSVKIPLQSVLNILIGLDIEKSTWTNIILKSRLPQTITALLAGSGLAVAGLIMQTFFRNPLAGPSVLGISSGSSLGVALVLLLAGQIGDVSLSSMGLAGDLGVTFAAFFGAIFVLVLMLFMAGKTQNNVTLLIIGMMIGYGVSALVSILKFYSHKDDLHAFVIWGMGSFAGVSQSDLLIFAPMCLLGLILAFAFIKPLNALLLGENYASNLGVNVLKIRWILVMISGLLVAIITAYTGPIAFIGLAVPHLCRSLFLTSDHKVLIPGVLLTGALIALACNLIARMPGFDSALPINAVTSLFGAPVVIWVIMKKKSIAG
ncbi:MAG: iron ABC transporter permease [Bacteroidales bacterium]|nr:iron ABC transporter permease [Bacteroidales bacterium]